MRRDMIQEEALPKELVKDFVTAAHGDFEEVKRLLAKEPALVNSVMNWGGDDWESALGAAAHIGHREIALFLLEHGARIDLFAAAMLGDLNIVQSMIESYPWMIDAKGPHGIPLIRHAERGGEAARPVLQYLIEAKGDMA